jgi:hypothetical protein
MGESMEHFANARHERRKTPRTTLDKVLYLNLEPDNGGIVLNISDGGLAFHAVAPIRQHRVVRFWFSLHNERLEASGELVWTDETKKAGGLRFTSLSNVTRVQIRNLIGNLPALADISAEPTQPASPLRLAVDKRESPHSAGPPVVREFPPLTEPPRPPAPDPSEPLHVNTFCTVGPPPEEHSHFSRGMLAGFLVAALVTASGSLFYTYRHEAGETLIQWGEKLQGVSRASALEPPPPQESVPASAPAPTPVPAAPAGTAEDPPATGQVAEKARDSTNPFGYAATAPNSGKPAASTAEDNGETDLAVAQRYLDGNGHVRNSAAAAQFLWAAVAKGNSTAELTLARLYLRGDGVATNCEQARVLLRAASAKGNTDAAQTSMDFYKNGCR